MTKKKVFDYVQEHHMLEKDDYVVVGVSGGADSVCLFFMLLEIQKELPITLHVVHINHMLRVEASAEADYVKALCEKFNIEFTLVTCDVTALAQKERISTEEAGRNARYRAFYDVLAQHGGVGKIAVAHNKNDCCETLLFHLFRGSALKGLSGIAPVRDRVIRPLMCLERQEIEAFLDKNGIKYCIDRTNLEDNYTRNRIRHHILDAAVQEISSAAVAHIYEAGEKIGEAYSFIGDMTGIAYKRCASVSENGIRIDKKRYEEEHPVIQGYILMEALGRVADSQKDIGAVHIEQLKDLFEKQCGRKINLPYRMCAERDYTGIMIYRADAGNAQQTSFTEYVLSDADRERLLRGACVKISLKTGETLIFLLKKADFAANKKNIPQKKYTKWFDYDKIKDNIVIRTRKTGDYLMIDAPEGKSCKKTLKSYFIDKKVPCRERDTVFLVTENNHVLWIVGERISSFYKVSDNTTRILEITFGVQTNE